MHPFERLMNANVNGSWLVQLTGDTTYDIRMDPNFEYANDISSIAFYVNKYKQPDIGESCFGCSEGEFIYIVKRIADKTYNVMWKTIKQ